VSGCIRARSEHTLRNGTAPSEIVLAGESAGAGLAVATLVNARDRGLPPPAATLVMSPYADLTLTGAPGRIHGGAPGLTRDERASEGPSRGESAAGAFAGSQG
jgi:acetyl esterase/lipase